MKHPSKLTIAYKALGELGPNQVGLYGIYKFGLSTGHYHRQLSRALSKLETYSNPEHLKVQSCLRHLPDRELLRDLLGDQIGHLYQEADEIVEGKVRLFGGEPVPFVLSLSSRLEYWSKYEGSNKALGEQDIKFIWEPARFGWACTLARAYYLSGDEKYAESFWGYTKNFLDSNPAYLGPHWTSAQEVAIRLVALVFAYQVFQDSSLTTPDRTATLAQAIAIHAERIVPTMVYARSQNNNHLITEALGLYTASAFLPGHPFATKWHRTGWKWLQRAFLTQIDEDGSYVQHSTNYHRLMLQAGLWACAVHAGAFSQEQIPENLMEFLRKATLWLWELVDPLNGRVPNLGHNDGAYFLPLALSLYSDYRPVLAASVQMFFHQKLKPEGAWNEMGYWLAAEDEAIEEGDWKLSIPARKNGSQPHSPQVIVHPNKHSWAYFRVARYRSRPAHADQLHVDLWWRGINLAQDPGSYLYNAPPPWDNSLMTAFVHNTVTVDGMDFMLRTSKFLYLDWAQASYDTNQASSYEMNSFTAHHDGYRKQKMIHRRKISALEDSRWEIIDRIDGPPGQSHTARLHWLLPDWEYKIEELVDENCKIGYRFLIKSPFGWITLITSWSSELPDDHLDNTPTLTIARAGERIFGTGETLPINGWISPTYGVRIPALACIMEITHPLPIEMTSEWIFPNEG